MMERIIVITTVELNESTNRHELIASHGVMEKSLTCVVLQNIHPSGLGAKVDRKINQWVIDPAEAARDSNDAKERA